MSSSVGGMEPSQSLALDLVAIDVRDPDALTRLIADHAVAPARRVWALPAPVEGEQLSDVSRQPVETAHGIDWIGPQPKLDVSTALFDPLLRGFVLFTRLFPGAIMTGESADNAMAVPNWVYFEHSREIAEFTWADIAGLVAGLFDASGARRRGHIPQANEAGLAELIEAQDLARAALATPPGDDPPLRNRREIGLRAVRPDAAFRLDEVLRAEVHQRAVWFAQVDLLFPIAEVVTGADGIARIVPPSDDEFLETEDDHGVYPTVIPETIRGAVALDLVATFSRERSVGTCELCGLPLMLSPHQVGRVDRGEAVFHPDCHPEHRRRWMRDYQRRRRTAL